jgi:hypothetical protein
MKKVLILGLAALLVFAFTLPASALESVFGGYWRTRAFSQQRFSGDDSSDQDLSRVDTRTRLYYTAILNDNLKFVNQFEWNVDWGDTNGGDAGADGTGIIRIRASYVDATMGPVRMTIGQQSLGWARGFIYSDQGSMLTLSTKMGEHLLPFTWLKINEGFTDNNAKDIDVVGFYPVFNFGDSFSLNPFIIYGYSKEGDAASSNPFSTYGQNTAPIGFVNDDGLGIYYLGVNADATLGSFNLWGTGIYQGGKRETTVSGVSNVDVKAYLVAGGLAVPVGPASLHGQAFYASGDDDPLDSDYEAFFGIDGRSRGWSYYWAEIMGNGVFDAQTSAGATANPSNLWAANFGVGLKPMEKLSLNGDLWYASLVEDDSNGNKKLGFELDLKATYQLVEGMSMELVAAYLFADDSGYATANQLLIR